MTTNQNTTRKQSYFGLKAFSQRQITDKMVRMSILKSNDSEVIAKEMRGVSQHSQSINAIHIHIELFPKYNIP